uniref:Uncharacterized protein n=1 Tax=Hyaloperonospora arabidopsidis (strain Emoy2) TaxID=559515 RepID=M4BDN4_HYAAE
MPHFIAQIIKSTDTMKNQEVDVARGGLVCTLAEWCTPQCSVLGSVFSIPMWVLGQVSRDSLR